MPEVTVWPIARQFGIILALSSCSGTDQDGRRASATGSPDVPILERRELAGSFLGQDPETLRRLLHDSVVVQPPTPDSASQGTGAIQYVVDLAAHTTVTESEFWPNAVTAEGSFVFEQGIWVLRAGPQQLRSSYMLRWRRTPEGWKVVLWRWSRFS